MLVPVAGLVLALWALSPPPDRPSTATPVGQAKAGAGEPKTVNPPPAVAPQAVPPQAALPPPSPPAAVQQPAEPMPEAAPDVRRLSAPAAAQAGAVTLSTDEIRELQGRLKTAGFNPGPADGIVGRMTRSAVRKYAQAQGLPDAAPNRDLLAHLRQEPAPKE